MTTRHEFRGSQHGHFAMTKIRNRFGDICVSETMFFDQLLYECHLHPGMHPGFRLDPYYHTHIAAPIEAPLEPELGYVSALNKVPYHPEHTDGWVGRPVRNCYTGSLLWLGDVVWRIGEYDLEVDSWHAKFPD